MPPRAVFIGHKPKWHGLQSRQARRKIANSFGVMMLTVLGRAPFFLSLSRRYRVSENIVYLSDADFESAVLKSDIPVLVDYWAEWCGPCRMIAPILEEIAKDYAGRVKIAKLNIDENPGTPPKYGIRGIPTLMLFKDGAVAATKVGALSKSQLASFLDGQL